MKTIVKRLFNQFGIDLAIHPIAKEAYSGPNIAFVHIAKCGGMSVDHAIRKSIAQAGQHRIDRDTTLATSYSSFGKEIASTEDSIEFSKHHAKQLTGVLDFYLSKNWHYVSGHVTVDKALLAKYASQYQFVTVLRDPVERLKSNYIYNKLTNTNRFMLPNKFQTDSLVEEADSILNSERGWQLANTQTMFLTGRYPSSSENAKQMQEEVIDNLKQFSVVGFLDDIDGFSQKVSQLTKVPMTIDKRNTVSSHTSKNAELVKQGLKTYFQQPATIEKLNTLCEVELENYQMAKRLFR